MKYLSLFFALFVFISGLKAQESTIRPSSDAQIEQRLSRVAQATDWYPKLSIQVTEGLVILKGEVEDEQKRKWIVDISSKLSGVLGVIDKTETQSAFEGPSVLSPAQEEMGEIVQKSYRLIPYIASSLLIIALFLGISFLFRRLVLSTLKQRNQNVLLRQSIANAVGLLFFLLGLYFALKSSGLSGLAVTVLGGTGFLGIGVGLALKGTFENYASGLMISLRELFRRGEIIQIDGFEGIVQSVTTQATTIIDYSGNSIIIPNSRVVDSVIKNITRNPLMRTSFSVGISYEDTIAEARKVILDAIALRLEKIVIPEPPVVVAVESLGSATVNLRVFFWFDASQMTLNRATSSVIEVTKEALMAANISMPDDAREIVFASPLKVEQLDSQKQIEKPSKPAQKPITGVVENTSELPAENELEDMRKIANSAAVVDKGEDLLS